MFAEPARRTALAWMARRRLPALLVCKLISRVRDLNTLFEDGSSLSEALVALDDKRVIETLLRSDWDPAVQAVSGWAAPTVAADLDALEALKAMIAGGVSVDLPNSNLTTALMIAGRQTNLRMVRALLEAGAKPNLQDKIGFTAAHWTVHKNRSGMVAVLEALKGFGANLWLRDFSGRSCFELDHDYEGALVAAFGPGAANPARHMTVPGRNLIALAQPASA
jgi:ankyrin repeat protein